MLNLKRQNIRPFLIASIFVLIAFGCRRAVAMEIFHNRLRILDKLLNLTRTFIYIGLYCAWGISVNNRMIQRRIRKILILVSVLMASWFIVREVKYRFVFDENIIRYLWYSYYIPLLLIPFLALKVSLLINKPEDYRPPLWTTGLKIITLSLIILVLTNDFHQLVFRFPKNPALWTEFDRTLGMLYGIVAFWVFFCIITAFTVMLGKCRIPQNLKTIWLPLIPFAAIGLYFILLAFNVTPIRTYFSDFAAVCCLMFVSFFELCIQCELIHSNLHYSDLFRASTGIELQITDNEYKVRYAARSAEALSRETMKSAEYAPIVLDNGKRLQSMPIDGGHAIWTENVSELLKLRETLTERQEELKERHALLQFEYDKEKRHCIIEEKNRLYDLLQEKTQTRLDSIDYLVKEYGKATNEQKKQKILCRIIVLGSFIKRMKDFVLSTDEDDQLSQNRLSNALTESFHALHYSNINGNFCIYLEHPIATGTSLLAIYEFFEDVIKRLMGSAHFINVRIAEINGCVRINILSDYQGSCARLCHKYPHMNTISDEDGTEFILDAPIF